MNRFWAFGLLCSSGAVPQCAAQGVITTLAGTASLPPDLQAPALAYPLGGVSQIVVDLSGNLYIADQANSVVLRLDPQGVMRRVAGNGLVGLSGDGAAAANASISHPEGIALDAAGNLYIADTGNNLIRVVSPAGLISTLAGSGQQARISNPKQLAIDAGGNLYVAQGADAAAAAVLELAPDGTITSVVSNVPGGPVSNPILVSPTAIAVNSSGQVYFTDSFNDRVYRIGAGGLLTTVVSGQGSRSLAFDGAGNLYISGATVTRLASDGSSIVVAGSGTKQFSGDGGPATSAGIDPGALALDSSQNLYIADVSHGQIRRVNTAGIIGTIAGNGSPRFFGDQGPASSALLYAPAGLTLDGAGNLYFADQYNNRVRRVDPGGAISTIAGDGGDQFSGDGGDASAASLFQPRSVAVDSAGNLYISDQGSNRIRKVNTNNVITTVAGDGIARFAGDGGPAITASLNQPSGLALDTSGNLYVADTGNQRIRVISRDGVIHTFAGNGQAAYSGDGGSSTASSLSSPSDVLAAPNGDVYIADTQNDRIRLARAGVINTFAGNGKRGFGGDGGPAVAANLNQPSGLALGADGSLYLADTGNLRIRVVAGDGTIATLAGNGLNLFAGDGGMSGRAALSSPLAVALDPSNNVFIADTGNQRIREVLATRPLLSISSGSISFAAMAGGLAPAPGTISATTSVPGVPFAGVVTTSAGGDWLFATPQIGVLPAAIEVSVDPTDLQVGTYTGLLTVAVPSASPTTQTTQVTFVVADPGPPTRTVDPDALPFAFVQGSAAKSSALRISNLGGGTLDFTVSIDTGATPGWLSVSASLGSATASVSSLLNVTADPGQLPAGTYLGTISIATSADPSPFVVTVTMTVTQAPQTMRLSQAGLTFTVVAGGGAAPTQTFGVINSGLGVMKWNAVASTLSGGSQWLTATPDSGSTDSSSLQVPTVTLSVDPTGLQAGQYYGQIAISSATALNAPQYVAVVLNVLPQGSDPGPQLQTNQLIFTAVQGTSSPGSQEVLIYDVSGTPISYRSGSTTLDGGGWLRYLPTDANIAPNQPLRLVVDVDVSQLTRGIYSGSITLQFSGSAVKLDVLLIVIEEGPAPAGFFRSAPQVCASTQLLPLFDTLTSGFTIPGGWPSSLKVHVFDDCGNPMVSGSVIVTFSNGDPPVSMESLRDGSWDGTWKVGARVGGVTLTAAASQPDAGLEGTTQIKGNLAGISLTAPPAVAHGGIANSASLNGQLPLAPGALISIFGSGLADEELVAPAPPYQTELGGASVLMAGQLLPILRAGSTQIDAIVPFGVTINTTHQLIVSHGTANAIPVDVTVAEAQPGIFTNDLSGSGQGEIRDSAGNYVQPGNPAKAGDLVTISCAGLGAVNVPLDAGAASPADPPAQVVDQVTLMIGGVPALTISAILEPGSVGRYQVVAEVPEGITPGDSVPVILTVATQSSPAVTMAIAP